MNFKIALKNVKKSMKDYAIYFLTLSVSVCIFYAFNSIGAQGKLVDTAGNKEILEAVGTAIGYISVFVSVVLGCLIIYANNFLIKRRKKELGLYMSLGMGKRKISTILVLEEIIIGIISLACGLIGGIILAQFLGILTIKLFAVGQTTFSIVISLSAIIKTIVYFGIIFILVMIFNVIIVSKYKLIDLLTAHKKNEKIKIKSPLISGLIFIVSIVVLIIAYRLIIKVGIVNTNELGFKMSIILGIVGTLLFFYGFTGFIILLIKRIQKIYYRKLNIFTVKQINSKINTNFISMAVICLMLFVTISLISVAVGFRTQNISKYTPFDATIMQFVGDTPNSIETLIDKKEIKMPEGSTYNVVKLETMNGETMEKALGNTIAPSEEAFLANGKQLVYFMSLSNYNKNENLLGKKSITLGKDDALVISNVTMLSKTIDNLKSVNKMNIRGKEFKIVDYSDENIQNAPGGCSLFIAVVNDNVLKDTTFLQSSLNIQYNNNKEAENFLMKQFPRGIYQNGSKGEKSSVVASITTKETAKKDQSTMTSMILYISMYIGVIFLVSSAAILSLQQLSEASDSYDRYVALRKIGASKRAINKSIFTQTAIYFGLPLVLALVHSVVGIYVAENVISTFGKSSIIGASLATMGVIILIYAGYFIVTYLGYKNIVKEK